jgi:hypothetical protein
MATLVPLCAREELALCVEGTGDGLKPELSPAILRKRRLGPFPVPPGLTIIVHLREDAEQPGPPRRQGMEDLDPVKPSDMGSPALDPKKELRRIGSAPVVVRGPSAAVIPPLARDHERPRAFVDQRECVVERRHAPASTAVLDQQAPIAHSRAAKLSVQVGGVLPVGGNHLSPAGIVVVREFGDREPAVALEVITREILPLRRDVPKQVLQVLPDRCLVRHRPTLVRRSNAAVLRRAGAPTGAQ